MPFAEASPRVAQVFQRWCWHSADGQPGRVYVHPLYFVFTLCVFDAAVLIII